jgi:hypothetical protein
MAEYHKLPHNFEKQKSKQASKPYRLAEAISKRKSRYGLSEPQFQELLETQNGLCAACGNPASGLNRNGKPLGLCVDHDHATGAVRALLCGTCNVGIGLAKDNPALLRTWANYLERTSGSQTERPSRGIDTCTCYHFRKDHYLKVERPSLTLYNTCSECRCESFFPTPQPQAQADSL